MKRFYYFLIICLWVLSFGAFGYLVFIKEFVIAISAVCTTAMAFPYVKSCFTKLIN